MSVLFTIGIITDIAFIIVVSSPVAAILGAIEPVYLSGIIITITAVTSCLLRNRGRLRFLPLPALVLAIVCAPGLITVFWILPAIAYAISITVKRSYRGLFDEFDVFYKIGAVLVTVLAIASNMNAVIKGSDNGAFFFALVFLCGGIIKLRCMRHKSAMLRTNYAFHAHNILTAIIILAVAAMLTGAVYVSFSTIQRIIPDIEVTGGEAPNPIEPIRTREPLKQTQEPVEATPEVSSEPLPNDTEPNMLPIQIAVFIILLILICIFISRRVNKTPEKDSGTEKHLYIKEPPVLRTHTNQKDRVNREAIRRIYRRFLRYCDSHNMPIYCNYTSSDVNMVVKQASSLNEQCDALRGIYMVARYDFDSTITREDVSHAKALVTAIKHRL